jgi:hypothetical protein
MVLQLASVSLPMMERLMGSLRVLVMPKMLVTGWRSRLPEALAMRWEYHPP